MTIHEAFAISHGYRNATIEDFLLAEEFILAYQNTKYKIGCVDFFNNNLKEIPYANC